MIMLGAEAEARGDTSYQLVLQIESKMHGGGLESSPAVQHAWPAAEYVIDAKKKGNLSRFLNHDGESPNVFAQMGAPHNRFSCYASVCDSRRVFHLHTSKAGLL